MYVMTYCCNPAIVLLLLILTHFEVVLQLNSESTFSQMKYSTFSQESVLRASSKRYFRHVFYCELLLILWVSSAESQLLLVLKSREMSHSDRLVSVNFDQFLSFCSCWRFQSSVNHIKLSLGAFSVDVEHSTGNLVVMLDLTFECQSFLSDLFNK